MSGMSGEIRFNSQGDRTEGLYLGVSAIPSSPPSPLLQPSNFILEDLISVSSKGIQDYQVATSSIFTREELLAVNVSQAAACSDETLEITAHDPFNQQSYSWSFNRTTLPPHILIPNQYGFGLTFECIEGAGEGEGAGMQATMLRVACTPHGRSLGETVHCFRSGVTRVKRSDSWRPSDYYYQPRDDSAPPNTLYYQPQQYYSYAPPAMMDSSTGGYATR